MELDRIRLKVWNGEALDDAELEKLERAAMREPGPLLKTTIAQALINADEHAQALGLLEALRREYPRDIQVHLALARALISLERWGDAERPLSQALELNPDDPEPVKAMATVALRRGEFARARALLGRVLERDPFDAEAKVLLEDVDAGTAPPRVQPVSLQHFVEQLVSRLVAQSTPHLVQDGALVVRVGRGQALRYSLEGLYRELVHSARPLDEALAVVAQEVSERSLGIPRSRTQLLNRALPVLRDDRFLSRGVGAARRDGPAGLWLFYAVENPEVVAYVPQGLLASLQLGLEELDEAAWRNLDGRRTAVRAVAVEGEGLRLSARPTGLWALAHGDGHDAARLLTVHHRQALAEATGGGPLRVFLGLRELVVLCREDDGAARARLGRLEVAPDGIAGQWVLHDGVLRAAR